MLSRRVLVILGFVALLMVGGAMAGFAWTQRPATTSDTAETATYKNHNERLKEVAQQVPEFGGLFMTEDGTVLNIYLAHNENDPGKRAEAVEALEDLLDVKSGLRLNVIKGDYTISQLGVWYDQMREDGVWDQEGVITTDLREAKNKLHVGVEDADDIEGVYTFLVGMGIPRSAVLVEVGVEEVPASHSLRDRAH